VSPTATASFADDFDPRNERSNPPTFGMSDIGENRQRSTGVLILAIETESG